MNDERLDKLFAAARQEKPDTTQAEYAFETRLMARIRQERAVPWFAWAWKLAPVFAAIVLALGVWNFNETADWHAALGGAHTETQLVNYLTGE